MLMRRAQATTCLFGISSAIVFLEIFLRGASVPDKARGGRGPVRSLTIQPPVRLQDVVIAEIGTASF